MTAQTLNLTTQIGAKEHHANLYALAPQPVWSELGTQLDPSDSIAEHRRKARMDWQVEKRPLFLEQDGEQVVVPDKVWMARKDDNAYLGVVGRQYEPVQLDEVFSMVADLSTEGVEFRRAGILRGGRMAWVLAEAPRDIAVGENILKRFILAITAFDGSKILSFLPTSQDIACGNEISGLERTADVAKFRHTRHVRERFALAADIFRRMDAQFEQLGTLLNALRRVKLTEGQVRSYLATVADKARHHTNEAGRRLYIETLVDRYHNGAGQESRGGNNAWAAFSAVTDTVDHVVRPHEWHRPSLEKEERRMFRATLGQGANTKRKALAIAREMFAPKSALAVA